MPDPELEIGREGGHPDPYIWGGGGERSPKKFFFGPSGLTFGLKIRGGQAPRAPPPDPPLYSFVTGENKKQSWVHEVRFL